MNTQTFSQADSAQDVTSRGAANLEPDRWTPRRGWLRGILYGGAVLVTVGVAYVGLRQLPIVSEFLAWYGNRPSAAAGQAAAKPEIPDSIFTAHARAAGVKTCSSLFATLGKALTEGSQYTTSTQWNKTDPDRHSVQSIVGLAYDGASGAGVVFASPQGQDCEGNLVRILPLSQSCQAAVDLLPSQSTKGESLANLASFNLPGGGQAVFVPAGTGCVAVTVVRGGNSTTP